MFPDSRYLKQRFYPLLCILGWRFIPLPLSKARIHTAYFELGWKNPGFAPRRRIRSQVSKAKKKGIIPNSWAWSPSPDDDENWWLLHVDRWQKGWDFFLAKRWYRLIWLMLHHNLWHLWLIYITSLVLFSSVPTLHVPELNCIYAASHLISTSMSSTFQSWTRFNIMPKWIQWFGYDYHIYIYCIYYYSYIHITHYIYQNLLSGQRVYIFSRSTRFKSG